MNIKEMAELLAVADELDQLKPAVLKIINHALSYGPEVAAFAEKFSFGITDIKVKVISRYEAAGFTRQEAIILTLSDMKGAMDAMKGNKGK